MFDEQLNEIFKGSADQSKWSAGFDDCVAGKENTSKCEFYNEGYSYAYELGEKVSVRDN